MALFSNNIFYDIVLSVTVLILTAMFYVRRKYRFWTNQGIIQIQPQFPFGNMKEYILRTRYVGHCLLDIHNNLKKQNVPYGGYYLGLKPYLIVLDLELIKHVLIKDFQYFTDKAFYCNEKTEPLTGHLVSFSGARWKYMRTRLTPTFTSGKLKMMFQTLVATSYELENLLEEVVRKAEPLDIKDIVSRFGIDVIGSCAFGIECNSCKTPDNEFAKYCKMVIKPRGMDLFRSTLATVCPKLMKLFGVRVLNRAVSSFFINMVEETVRYREENHIKRNDFLQILLELRGNKPVTDEDLIENVKENDGGKVLSAAQMAAQCFLFFLAGFETSASTTSWTLYELTQNLDVQERLRTEIVYVLKKYNGEITYEALMEMKYLDQVINETLRMHLPITYITRQCTQDYRIPNSKHILRKGQIVRISLLGIHYDPAYHSDPEKFNPERFTEEEKKKMPLCAFMPFGEGPRQCLGLRFALMQTKVGLITLLKDYRFRLNKETKLPVEIDPTSFLILIAKDEIWLDAYKVTS